MVDDSFPRSSADFDHGFREIFLKSPNPREGDRTGDAWLRALEDMGPLSNAPVRARERSRTDLSGETEAAFMHFKNETTT